MLSSAIRSARLLAESSGVRDHLARLLDHANAPIIVLGPQRDVRAVNRAFLGLTGLDPDLVMGRDFLDLIPEDERAPLLAALEDALRGEPSAHIEVRVPRADGGLARLSVRDWDFVVKLDADLSFGPEYFETLLRRFDANPRLGMASGKTFLPTPDGGRKLEWCHDEHVRGPAKMYARACFEARVLRRFRTNG